MRLLTELELHRDDAHGLDSRTIPDLAARFVDEGGTATSGKDAMGRTLLTAPSGLGLGDWVQRLKESGTADHLFAPPAVEPAPAPAAKVKVDKKASATDKLSLANGHAPIRPNGGR
ncbi:MAG: hypothetical protein KJ676_14620 [Alphaproteobacteria bacterium]|nr:hypothetical protein [Alphaproteobacteria bacterium]MBU1526917.1 hypothetical protein [Alphaproteobacteria bacterium]MBU2352507.1 hypothetical protein [Alphaproteobacteria bacterium]MBU2382009.1 hypothetical protein [Alphaproteobacteria bacterium]